MLSIVKDNVAGQSRYIVAQCVKFQAIALNFSAFILPKNCAVD
ncbi:hypothetical protein [Acinetobacter marinus]|nr:hypothetical protein [Acinetobacter marinus]